MSKNNWIHTYSYIIKHAHEHQQRHYCKWHIWIVRKKNHHNSHNLIEAKKKQKQTEINEAHINILKIQQSEVSSTPLLTSSTTAASTASTTLINDRVPTLESVKETDNNATDQIVTTKNVTNNSEDTKSIAASILTDTTAEPQSHTQKTEVASRAASSSTGATTTTAHASETNTASSINNDRTKAPLSDSPIVRFALSAMDTDVPMSATDDDKKTEKEKSSTNSSASIVSLADGKLNVHKRSLVDVNNVSSLSLADKLRNEANKYAEDNSRLGYGDVNNRVGGSTGTAANDVASVTVGSLQLNSASGVSTVVTERRPSWRLKLDSGSKVRLQWIICLCHIFLTQFIIASYIFVDSQCCSSNPIQYIFLLRIMNKIVVHDSQRILFVIYTLTSDCWPFLSLLVVCQLECATMSTRIMQCSTHIIYIYHIIIFSTYLIYTNQPSQHVDLI